MVLVTGGTGHIGNVLVRKLVQRGESVRVLVLPGESRASLQGLEVEFAEGNVLDRASCRTAMAGVDVVYHLAGIIAIAPGTERLMWEVNVTGARTVAQAAAEMGVRRLVHVGSVHAFARGPGQVVDERTPLALTAPWNNYDRTKAEGVAAALDLAQDGLDVAVACPSGVIGPYDYLGSEMGRLIRTFARPGYHLLTEGGFDFVDVRDVADGLIQVADQGRGGEIYILSGTYVSLAELHQSVQAVANTKSASVVAPTSLALAIGRIMPYYYRLTRTIPQITTYSVLTVAEKCRFLHGKAGRELGYEPRPLLDTIEDTLLWWQNLAE
ncbi:MAG: NAD-dependent epimerase/dehydratase family protein [bacterium]|jgi:dihydroflavonol-4-reductase|nr:NAD-dependent epimerase/dehydratase family protein [Bacillota bacterium]